MKVKEVIAELQKFDQELECFMAYEHNAFASIRSVDEFDNNKGVFVCDEDAKNIKDE